MTSAPIETFGTKFITSESFFESDFDPIINQRTRQKMTHEEWTRLIYSWRLPPSVPTEIHKMFVVIQGTIIYGWLYWPLLTVGSSQLFTLRETLAREACVTCNAPKSKTKTFEDCINFLADTGRMPPQERARWHAGRDVRNMFSHPTARTIIGPMVECELELFVKSATELFPP